MPSFDDVGLDARGRALVVAALADDPALAEEVELIASLLGEKARRCFWRAFACECRRRNRPAGAVLAALERAATEASR